MRKHLTILIAVVLTLTSIVMPFPIAKASVTQGTFTILGAKYETPSWSYSTNIYDDTSISFGFENISAIQGGTLTLNTKYSYNVSADTDYTATLQMIVGNTVVDEKSTTFKLTTTATSANISLSVKYNNYIDQNAYVRIVIHDDTNNATVVDNIYSFFTPLSSINLKNNLPTELNTGETYTITGNISDIPTGFHKIAIMLTPGNYLFSSNIASDGTFAGVYNSQTEGIFRWVLINDEGNILYLNTFVNIKINDFIFNSPETISQGQTVVFDVALPANSLPHPSNIYIEMWGVNSIIKTIALSEVTDSKGNSYYVQAVSIPSNAVKVIIKTGYEPSRNVYGNIYKTYIVKGKQAIAKSEEQELIANGKNQFLHITITDSKYSPLANATYEFYITDNNGSPFCNYSEPIKSTLNSNGSFTITIPGTCLAKNNHPTSILIKFNYVYSTTGTIYTPNTIEIPISPAEGIDIYVKTTPGFAGDNTIEITTIDKAIIDQTGFYEKVYVGVQDPDKNNAFPIINSSTVFAETLRKEDYYIGQANFTGNIAKITFTKEFHVGDKINLFILSDIYDQYGHLVNSKVVVKVIEITGYNYSVTTTATELFTHQNFNAVIKITDQENTPVNNAKVEVYAISMKDNTLVPMHDVFGFTATIEDSNGKWIIPYNTNIVNGEYDFQKLLATTTLSATLPVVIYFNAYTPDNQMMIYKGTVATIEPQRDLDISITPVSLVVPGEQNFFKVSSSQPIFIKSITVKNKDKNPFTYSFSDTDTENTVLLELKGGTDTYKIIIYSKDYNHSGIVTLKINPVTVNTTSHLVVGFYDNVKVEFTIEGTPVKVSTITIDDAPGFSTYITSNITNAKIVVNGEKTEFTIAPLEKKDFEFSIWNNGYYAGSFTLPVEEMIAKLITTDGEFTIHPDIMNIIKADLTTTATMRLVDTASHPLSNVFVNINGYRYRTDNNGYIEFINLQNGINVISIEGASVFNYKVEVVDTHKEIVDTELNLIISSLAQSATDPTLYISHKKNITLAGQITASSSVNDEVKFVFINGEPVNQAMGYFAYKTSLKEGINTFVIHAVTEKGIAKDFIIKVQFINIPPSITVIGGTKTSTESTTWYYNTDETVGTIPVRIILDTPVKVAVNNGIVYELEETGVIEVVYNIPANSDHTILVITVTDNNGNVITNKIYVYYNPYLHKKEIKLFIDKTDVIVNGIKSTIDVAPFIDPQYNRTMVPLRFIAEEMGYTVTWDGKTRTIEIIGNDKTIVFHMTGVKTNEAIVVDNITNVSNTVTLDAPAIIKNNRTFVPLRFVAETFGFDVQWIPNERSVVLTKVLP